MRNVSYDDVIKLRKDVNRLFSLRLHFHDYCEGHLFTIEKCDENVKAFVTDFFEKRGMKVFFKDDVSFYVD